MIIWAKQQSITDAQGQTKGSVVKHLRLTRSDNQYDGQPIPFETFFRDVFFAGCAWQTKPPGAAQPGETATVPFHVTMFGADLGVHPLVVDHAPDRHHNNHAPTTHVIYDQDISDSLQANGNPNNWVVLIRKSDGSFHLVVT